jgi:hypothetical protein
MQRWAEIENWSNDIYHPAPAELRPNVNKNGLRQGKNIEKSFYPAIRGSRLRKPYSRIEVDAPMQPTGCWTHHRRATGNDRLCTRVKVARVRRLFSNVTSPTPHTPLPCFRTPSPTPRPLSTHSFSTPSPHFPAPTAHFRMPRHQPITVYYHLHMFNSKRVYECSYTCFKFFLCLTCIQIYAHILYIFSYFAFGTWKLGRLCTMRINSKKKNIQHLY